MKQLIFSLVLFSSTIKYQGSLTVAPNIIHKAGVRGNVDMIFDDEKISKVELKTEKAVFGKTHFTSSEQAVFSRVVPDGAQMAVVFKLQGAPHKWYFVYIGTTVDLGASYLGKLHSVSGSLETIAATLKAGQTPSEWKDVGTASLNKVTQ
jgi:hypothetical protein